MQFDVKFPTVVNAQLRMTTKSLKSFFQARAKLRSTTWRRLLTLTQVVN